MCLPELGLRRELIPWHRSQPNFFFPLHDFLETRYTVFWFSSPFLLDGSSEQSLRLSSLLDSKPSTAFSNEVGIDKWTLSKLEMSLRSHEGETLVYETLNEGMCVHLYVSSISTAHVFYTPAVVQNQKALLLLDQGSGKIPDSWAFSWDVGFINLPKVKILRLIPRQTQLVSAAVITGEEGGEGRNFQHESCAGAYINHIHFIWRRRNSIDQEI